jgi:hypothetical protein
MEQTKVIAGMAIVLAGLGLGMAIGGVGGALAGVLIGMVVGGIVYNESK